MRISLRMLFVLILSACDSPAPNITEEITHQFQSSGRTFVNLATVVQTDWDKVCILGPYSTSKHANETLGFSWPLEVKSTIGTSDRIALLLFVKNHEIVEFVEHPRRDGDFANLSRQCVTREKAIFHHLTNPPKGWPGLFPKK